MSAGIYLSDFEFSKLIKKPQIDFVLYCSLKKMMDYKTGIVGLFRSISYQALANSIQQKREKGNNRKIELITDKAVERSIKRLERIGLVVNQNKDKNHGPIIKLLEHKYVEKNSFRRVSEECLEKRPVKPVQDVENKGFEQVLKDDENYDEIRVKSNLIYNIYNNNNYKKHNYYLDEQKKGEEKMNIEIKEKKVKKPRAKKNMLPVTFLTEDFMYDESLVKFAEEKDLPHPSTEIDNFVNYFCSKKPEARANWPLSFKNWLRKADEIRKEKAQKYTENNNNGAQSNETSIANVRQNNYQPRNQKPSYFERLSSDIAAVLAKRS
jgi:hypothetical protein